MGPFNPDAFEQFGIPVPKKTEYTYVGSGAANDDKVDTITYKNDQGNIIGVLKFLYVGTTNNILSIERIA